MYLQLMWLLAQSGGRFSRHGHQRREVHFGDDRPYGYAFQNIILMPEKLEW